MHNAQAAVNYGQFAYAGFMPNYPTNARKPLPKAGSPEHDAMVHNPDRFMLDSLASKSDAMQVRPGPTRPSPLPC